MLRFSLVVAKYETEDGMTSCKKKREEKGKKGKERKEERRAASIILNSLSTPLNLARVPSTRPDVGKPYE